MCFSPYFTSTLIVSSFFTLQRKHYSTRNRGICQHLQNKAPLLHFSSTKLTMDAASSSRAAKSALDDLKSVLKKLNGAPEVQENVSASTLNSFRVTRNFLVTQLLAARNEVEELKTKLGHHENSSKKCCQHAVVTYKAQRYEGLKDPLDIFPIEVWSIILEKLSNPTDVANCYRATKTWEQELKPRRVEFLFKEILPILLKSGYLNLKPAKMFNYCLQFRFVCHSWKAGVDGILESLPPNTLAELHNTLRRCTLVHFPRMFFDCHTNHLRKLSFSSQSDILRCQSYFKENKLSLSSFFLGRAICLHGSSVKPDEDEEAGQMWPAAFEFFKPIGSQIRSCVIRVEFDAQKPTLLYDVLSSCFSQMGNLKMLDLHCDRKGNVEKFKKNLEIRMMEQPLAFPTNLQVFRVHVWLPQSITWEILRANGNSLKNLHFSYYDDEVYSNSHFEGIHLPNLEVLSLKFYSGAKIPHLQTVLNACPSLHCLSVEILSFPELHQMSELFEHLNLKENIKTLRLNLGSMCWASFNPLPAKIHTEKLLHLPHLENLEIVTNPPAVVHDLDFMLPLQSLKTLRVRIEKSYSGSGSVSPILNDRMSESAINYLGYHGSMYESNIWSLFPNLKHIRIEMLASFSMIYSYSRNGYDKYCKNRANT